MSYILNALRKSELQRQHGESESLENKILQNDLSDKKNTSIWVIGLVIINLLLLGYFIWSFSQEKQQSNILHKAEILSEVDKKILTKTRVKPQQKHNSAKNQHASIAERIKQNQLRKLKAVVNENSLAIKHNNRVLNGQNNLAKDKKLVSQPIIDKLETTVLVERSNKEIIKQLKVKSKQEAIETIPFLSELDHYFRRSVPKLDMNVFVYSENKADRFIMVDMRKFKTGEQVAQGMTLKEIRIDSIVVEFNNRIFQIKRK